MPIILGQQILKYPAMHQFHQNLFRDHLGSRLSNVWCVVVPMEGPVDHHHVKQCPLVPIDATVIARQQLGNTETHCFSATEF